MTEIVPLATPVRGTIFDVGLVGEWSMGKSKKTEIVVNHYDERFLDYFAEMLREYPQNSCNCTVLVTGRMTSGKSSYVMGQARKVDDRHFSQDKVAFRLSEFNRAIKRNPVADPANNLYPQVQLDEAGYDLFSQSWMESVQRELVKNFEVIGAKRQITWLCLPHRELLNKKMREQPIDFWVNIVMKDLKRGIGELRKGLENPWHIEKYWQPQAAFLFPPVLDDFYREYRVRKMSFIQEVLEQKDAKETPAKTNQRDVALRLAYQTGMFTLEELADQLNLTRGRLSQIVNSE